MTEPPIQEIVRRIVEAHSPRRVLLFGSRARGDARPDSDVDLLIEMETPLSFYDRVRSVSSHFRSRWWSMDLFVFTPGEVAEQRRSRNSIVTAAEREGKVLYEQG